MTNVERIAELAETSVESVNDLLLVSKIIKKMQRDFDNQDVSAIERLLMFIPIKHLESFLEEDIHDKT